MNKKIKKALSYMAAAAFLLALAINVKVTLDDPFVMMSDEAVATGTWSSNLYILNLGNTGSTGGYWLYGFKIKSDNIFEDSAFNVEQGTDISYNATTNTAAVGSSIGVGYSEGNLTKTEYRCKWTLSQECDQSLERDVFIFNQS